MIIFSLQILNVLIRKLTKHSGTALPGLYLEKYFPNKITPVLSKIDNALLITGTNGKTTTTKMICEILKSKEVDFINNSSGSNMLRGILSTVINHTNPFTGALSSKSAILEVEEGTFPKLTKYFKKIDVVVVTNVFRDQLDAYGEITKTISYIKEAIKSLDNPILILNGDDRNISSLSKLTNNSVFLIKTRKEIKNLIKYESEIFSEELEKNNENSQNIFEVWIDKIVLLSDDLNFKFDISIPKLDIVLKNIYLSSPGMHNAINATYALIASNLFLDSNLKSLKDIPKGTKALADMDVAFGRGEIIKYKNTKYQSFLVKNPAGMNLNLQSIIGSYDKECLIFILNDNIADGRDVSWIWDCDFSSLVKDPFKKIIVTGTRRFDMFLRLKYEGVRNISEVSDIKKALFKTSKMNLDKVYILPTYTSMLEYREIINKLNGKNEKY